MKRLLCFLLLVPTCLAQPDPAEELIAAGHWKRARSVVEARIRERPGDPLANYLLSQIHNAFGDHATPLALAEKAAAADGHVAKYHRQIAEVLGVMAQHAGLIQQLVLAQRFRREIDTALALDARDTQAIRDLEEFYLLAPRIAGGDARKAVALANRIGEISAPLGDLAQARIAAFHKNTAGTEEFLRKAAAASPPDYGAHIALAKFYLDAVHFNWSGAESEARAALKMDPFRVDSYSILAETAAHRSDWNELEATLTAAAAAVPDDLVPYYRAAERLLTDGRDRSRAERYLDVYLGQEAEGNEPTAADAQRLLGRHRN